MTSPGNDAGKPLAGVRAFQAFAAGEVVAAHNASAPIEVANGCDFHYHMFKGDQIHVAVERPTTTSILWIEWNHDTAFPVALMSWAVNGLPIFEAFGRSNYDQYIWDFGLQGDQIYRTHPEGYDLFHCMPGCTAFDTTSPHFGETGALWVTLDTQFEGDDDTVFTGSWRFYFRETANAMKPVQYMALQTLYLKACSPYRNGTKWWEPWHTAWSWAHHSAYIYRDPDSKPYCDWLMSTGWDNSSFNTLTDAVRGPCGNLEHVLCDENGNVILIDLHTAGLRGNLPSDLGSLTALRRLRLPYNQLNGTLPHELLQLNSLEEVVLHHNMFKGAVPCFSSRNLRDLFIDWNQFTGTLPECLGQLPVLEHFSCYHSRLHGPLPASLGNLLRLQRLAVGSNSLTGTVPAGLCKLVGLRSLDLSKNQFRGELPAECFRSAIRLYSLELNFNEFSGTLPPVGPEMIYLKVLDLSHNKIEGPITDQLQVIADHTFAGARSEVHLNDNRFNGQLPHAIYNLVHGPHPITSLNMNDNKFRCETGGGWPDWAMRLPQEYSKKLGKCLPVPQALETQPTWGYSGQEFIVTGLDFVPQEPRCRFTNAGFSDSVPAMFMSTRRIQCFVPAGLPAGKYSLTVSNFGSDYATDQIYPDMKVVLFTVVPVPVVVVESPRVTMTVLLSGLHRENFFEPTFIEEIAKELGVESKQVIIDEVVGRTKDDFGAAEGVVNQDSTEVSFAVQVENGYEAQAVRDRLAVLGSSNHLTRIFDEHFHDVVGRVLSGPNTEAFEVLPEEKTKEVLSPWGIFGIVVLILTACSCFVFGFWIVRREKKGNPYFLEECEEEIMEEVNSRTFSITPASSANMMQFNTVTRPPPTRVMAPKRSNTPDGFTMVGKSSAAFPDLT